jgi:hypothetical protein
VRSLAFSTAATPSSASQQALKGVALSMKLQMAPRTAALSSTTKIHGVRGDGMADESTSVYCLRQYEFSVFFAVLILRRLPVRCRSISFVRYRVNRPSGMTACFNTS